jgi:hypothetical protein
MKLKFFLVITGILMSINLLRSQSKDSLALADISSRYIEYMSNYINLKLAHTSDVDELSVITDGNDIFLSPNASSFSQLFFNYRFISFSIRYIPKWLPGNDDDDVKGKTKGGGFGLNLNFDRWLQELSYSKTKGYYLENTADYDPSWSEGDPYIQFPNLQFLNFQGITAYKFNPNFSVNAVATQTERQVRSAGSFIPQLLYRYYIIENKEDPEPNQATQKSNNFEMVLGAGYYHTFVLKNDFYISLGATPGVGTVYTKLTTRFPDEEIYTNQKNTIFRVDGKAGIGYNGPRFFAGVYSKIAASSVEQQKTSVVNQDTRFVVQGFVGYRLNAPKWMRDNVDKVGEMIGK